MPIRPPTELLATSASAPALRARSGTLPQPGQPVANAEATLVRSRVTIGRAAEDDVGDVGMHDGPPAGESWLVSGCNHRPPSRQSLDAWWVCHLAVIPPSAVPLSRFFPRISPVDRNRPLVEPLGWRSSHSTARLEPPKNQARSGPHTRCVPARCRSMPHVAHCHHAARATTRCTPGTGPRPGDDVRRAGFAVASFPH